MAWWWVITLALMSKTQALVTVGVIGTTGRLGRATIQQLVAQGYAVRALLRHELVAGSGSRSNDAAVETAAQLAALPGVTMVRGDVTDRASLDELLRGCSVCLAVHGARRTRKISDLWSDPTTDITHSKQVNYMGVRNIISAALASGTCRRIVRITGKGESPWSLFSILLNTMGCMAKAVRASPPRPLRHVPALPPPTPPASPRSGTTRARCCCATRPPSLSTSSYAPE